MTKFYCLKCKGETDTKDEEQVTTLKGRHMLRGTCTKCGKNKSSFVSKDWVLRPAKERKKAKDEKEMKDALKSIVNELATADSACLECVHKCLKQHDKRKGKK